MRGLLGILGAFKGGIDDRKRPDANVGAAFLVAALIVAVVGLKWMGSGGGDDTSPADGWALGGTGSAEEVAGSATTIPASPAAVAVPVGAENPGTTAGDLTETSGPERSETTMTLPDGSAQPSPSDPAAPGDTLPDGSTPTTHTTTSILQSTTSETPTTSENTTTSESTTTTNVVPTAVVDSGSDNRDDGSNSLVGGLLDGVVGLLGL